MGLKEKKWVTTTVFAKNMQCDVSLVFMAIKEKKISTTRGTNGQMMIDLNSQSSRFLQYHPRAAQKVLANVKKTKEKEERKERKISKAMAATEALLENEKSTEIVTVAEGIAVSKARKEKALARKAELDAEEREGSLVDLPGMMRIWKTAAIETRKAIMSIPDRLAPVMAGERDQHKCHRMLTDELTHALRMLSQNLRDGIDKQMTPDDEVDLDEFAEEPKEGEDGQ